MHTQTSRALQRRPDGLPAIDDDARTRPTPLPRDRAPPCIPGPLRANRFRDPLLVRSPNAFRHPGRSLTCPAPLSHAPPPNAFRHPGSDFLPNDFRHPSGATASLVVQVHSTPLRRTVLIDPPDLITSRVTVRNSTPLTVTPLHWSNRKLSSLHATNRTSWSSRLSPLPLPNPHTPPHPSHHTPEEGAQSGNSLRRLRETPLCSTLQRTRFTTAVRLVPSPTAHASPPSSGCSSATLPTAPPTSNLPAGPVRFVLLIDHRPSLQESPTRVQRIILRGLPIRYCGENPHGAESWLSQRPFY